VVLKDLSSPILILIVLQGLLSHPLFHGACVCNLCVCYAREVCRGPLSRHTRAAPEAGKRKGEAGRHTSSALLKRPSLKLFAAPTTHTAGWRIVGAPTIRLAMAAAASAVEDRVPLEPFVNGTLSGHNAGPPPARRRTSTTTLRPSWTCWGAAIIARSSRRTR
jgi:hypothetical protein